MSLGVVRRELPAICSLMGLVLSSCAAEDGTAPRSRAAELATAYLELVGTREGDMGWSLIFHASDEWQNYDAYRKAVADADWSTFEVDVLGGVVCDDDSACVVCLQIPGGRNSVPGFLLATSPRVLDGISFNAERCGPYPGDAVIGVVLSTTPWGDTGVMMPSKD